MRIRGKKPWALIDGKIARFSSQREFDAYFESYLHSRLQQANPLDDSEFLTIDEMFAHLEDSDRKLRTLARVSRRNLKGLRPWLSE